MANIRLRRLSSALLLLTLPALPLLARPAAAGAGRWTPIGPEGGELVSLAADPDAPGVLYAGTSSGSVWKSLDGGGSWSPTAEGLGAAPASSLAVAAGRVYAGTFSGLGLRVLNEGATAWRPIGPFPFGLFSLAVDPADPARLWMTGVSGGGGEILGSDDAGEHWGLKLKLQYSLYAVAVAPTVPSTVYTGGDEGLFASRDGGVSWRPFDAGDGPVATGPRIVGNIEVDPEDPETVYVTAYAGLWKTTDGGGHWTRPNGEASFSSLLALPGALLGVLDGGVLARSEDGGSTWDPVEPASWGSITALEADPAVPGAAWIAGTGGIFRSADGGRTWERRPGRDLRATSLQAFAFDPFRPGALYVATLPFAGAAFGKLQRSLDDGASWSPLLPVLDISSLTADPRRPATLYAGTPRGIAVSRDRGAHWQRLLRVPTGIHALAVDPHRPGTMWAAGRRVWRSRNAGRTWNRLATFGSGAPSIVRGLFPSPWHPGTLYLVDGFVHLWRSTDDGDSWEALDAGFPAALAFDPETPDLLYVAGTDGSLRKSRDGGTTWEPVASDVAGGFNLTSLLVDRLDPSILYLGTAGDGIWRSLDRGVTWQRFSADLAASAITCLEADPRNPRRLVACTQGGGLMEIWISSGS